MPLYEYRCDDCQQTFEALVRAGQADEAGCPTCGTSEVRRLLSVFSAPRSGARGGDGAAAPSGGCCGGACGHC